MAQGGEPGLAFLMVAWRVLIHSNARIESDTLKVACGQ
jgi:hypothetical protein